ncbi:HAD family hydrolase [Escherichia coli]
MTLGNRRHQVPAQAWIKTLADAAQLASLADETPEGRSIVILPSSVNLRERDVVSAPCHLCTVTAQSRIKPDQVDNRMIRKGYSMPLAAMLRLTVVASLPMLIKKSIRLRVRGPHLVVVEGSRVLGVIALKDIVKGGIKERFAQLRQMGIKTVMITGDNRLTAAAIAAEAGVDDFLAEATPEASWH